MTASPRIEFAGGSPPDSWSREELRDAIREVRRYEREIELWGHSKSSSPTALLMADMLEQLLDETEPEADDKST